MAASASSKDTFTAAVNVVRTLPKDGSFQPSREMMLKFYAFYKQATLGPCTDPKPGFWDVVGKAKWDAWSELHAMSEEDAMTNYVDQLKQIVEAMPHSDSVQNFLEKLGSFYEMIDTVNGRATRQDYSDVAVNVKALTERPADEDETKHAVSASGTSTTQYVESTTKNTDMDASTGDSGTVSSDEESDSVASQPQKESSSEDTTHLTNGDTVQCHVTSPTINGDRSALDTSHDDRGVTSEDNDSDTEVYCDTSDLPLELPQGLQSPPGREFPTRELDASLPGYSNTLPPTDMVSASKSGDWVAVKKDLGMGCGGNGGCENRTPEHVCRHQTFPEGSPACPAMTSYGMLVQRRATRGGGMEQPEGDGAMPTSTPRTRNTTSGSQQTGSARQHAPIPTDQHASFCPCLGGAGGGDDDRWSHDHFRSEVNEQMTLALLRLQQDMNSVLARVRTLEVQQHTTRDQQKTTESSGDSRQSQSARWWMRPLSGRGMLFVIVWPILVHLFLSYIRRRCKRQTKWTSGKR